jgi:hypothetical protein
MIALLAAAIVLAQEPMVTAPPVPRPSAAPAPTPAPQIPPASAVPGDLSTAPPLPNGPLAPVAKDESGETFLVVDRASRVGGSADFWAYEVFTPPIRIRDGVFVVQGLAHHLVDCDTLTDQRMASAGYDEAGAPVVALAAGPPAPVTPGGAYDLISKALCKGRIPPRAGAAMGHTAALAEARAPSAP